MKIDPDHSISSLFCYTFLMGKITQPNKISYIRIIITLLFTLYFLNCIESPGSFHFINSVNLIIHEAGHFIFIFFGQFIDILGGSLLQVLIPLLFAIYFFLRRDNFAGGLILMWVGQNITEVARYVSDATVMQIPLLGGDGVIHDWNYLLSTTGLLEYTSTIGNLINAFGIMTLIAGIAIALYAIFRKDPLIGQI